MKRIFLVALVMLLLPTVASAQWNVQPGYRSFYDLGVGIGTGDESKTNFEVSTSQGYQLVPTYFYIGTGAAFQAFFNADGACGFPVFVNLRSHFSPGKVSPFVDVRVGYASVTGDHYDNGGFYLCPTLGIRFAINNNFGINLRAGYTWENARLGGYVCYYPESFGCKGPRKNIGGANIQIGIDF